MKRIFALIDFSNLTRRIIDFGADQARLHQAELYIIHICPTTVHNFRNFRGILATQSSQLLQNKAQRLNEILNDLDAKSTEINNLGISCQSYLIEEKSELSKTIIEEARKHKADLIVIGQHRHSAFYNSFSGGSLADHLISRIPCPLMIIPEKQFP